MEQLKVLVAKDTTKVSGAGKQHKDKLAQTKKIEKELKEAIKEKKVEEKKIREDAHHAEVVVNRLERGFHPESKRAHKDEREAKKHAEKKAEGTMCEHGVWKCRICHPVIKHK